ncbi:MAG: hypothetical protein ACI9D8_000593 [Reinekea sp.]|jgi:hypothetical protein
MLSGSIDFIVAVKTLMERPILIPPPVSFLNTDTQGFFMKRFSIILLLLTGFATLPTVHAANEVSLVSAMSRVYSYRHGQGQAASFVLRVANLSAEKSVNVHYQGVDGTWRDIGAAYQGVAGDGLEIWHAQLTLCTVLNSWNCDQITATDLNFAISLAANGQVYWDNNGGHNYLLGQDDGYLMAATDRVQVHRKGELQCDFQRARCDLLGGQILVRNIAPIKAVSLWYSVDNWQTHNEVSAQFIDPERIHPLEHFTNPGVSGGELWRFDIIDFPKGPNDLQYYARYDYGAFELAIDNNAGQNYRLGIPDFPSVSVRGTHNNWAGDYGSIYMQKFTSFAGDSYWQGTFEFTGHSPSERFKFDIEALEYPWRWNYGDNDNDGRNWQGIAERDGGDIHILGGPGFYRITLFDDSHAYRVEKIGPGVYPSSRTIVFIEADNPPGQETFLRGGIGWDYAREVRGIDCSKRDVDKWACALPIRHRIAQDDAARAYDWNLDWYGAEDDQGDVEGSPLVWTTNNADFGQSVFADAYGYTPLNQWGDNYWMLDVDLYCSDLAIADADGSLWFEFKTYDTNGVGWESDISQANTPYASANHFAQCGKINLFKRNSSEVQVLDF